MAASISKCKISNYSQPTLFPESNIMSLFLNQLQFKEIKRFIRAKECNGRFGHRVVVDCAKFDGFFIAEQEVELSSGENWGFDYKGNCQEWTGIVELMECLEAETIMGENEDKEANDYYNRRAQIFDKSPQVFRAP